MLTKNYAYRKGTAVTYGRADPLVKYREYTNLAAALKRLSLAEPDLTKRAYLEGTIRITEGKARFWYNLLPAGVNPY